MVAIHHLNNFPDILQPRRIMKYVLIYCEKGELEVNVDDNTFSMSANTVITITSGQVHVITKMSKSTGWVLEFTYDFFCKSDHDVELVFHNSLFCHFGLNEVNSLNQSLNVKKELATIQTELSEKPYQYLISVHSRIELILVEINRQKITAGGEVWKPDALFLKFLETVRANFGESQNVQDIALQLSTTPAKLNQQSKLHTGKTAQNVIYGLVASEAKRLFKYNKISVKEVAFSLGFSDPFYFSKFFKKQTGVSPKEYVESYAVLNTHL